MTLGHPAHYVSLDPFKVPFKNSNTPCVGPTVGASCRGIVTSDVLVKGLSCGAIATRKLEGVNQDKGHEWFILVQPLTMKVKPMSSCDWDYVCLDNQGANRLT